MKMDDKPKSLISFGDMSDTTTPHIKIKEWIKIDW